MAKVRDNDIEHGAEAIVKDLRLPGGGFKKLARVVETHLAWFDVVEARGMTWGNIAALLFAAGAKDKDGRAFTIGTLSSAVWRKRNEAKHDQKKGPRPRQHDQHLRSSNSIAKKAPPGTTGPSRQTKGNPSGKSDTLAYMKRAAAIRGSKS